MTLIDRDEQVGAVRSFLDDSTRIGVLITGDAGVGKSFFANSILDELSNEDVPTKRVVGGGADDLPLGALARAFSHDETYSGIAPLVSLKRLLGQRDRSTAILIDDVNLLDVPTLAILIELAESRLAQLLITLRSGIEIPALIEHALTSGALAAVECRPFGRQATDALAQHFADGPLGARTLRSIFDLSRGNSLYVRELVAATQDADVREAIPSERRFGKLPRVNRLVDLMEQRLRSLDPDERDALRRIAIADGVGHQEIAGFVDDETLRRLEQRDLITTVLDGRRLRITTSHPLHAEIIRSTESPLVSRRIRAEHAVRLQELGGRRGHDRLRLATWSLQGICTVDTGLLVEASRMAAAAGDATLSRGCAEAAYHQEPNIEHAHLLATTLTAIGDIDALAAHFPRWEALIDSPAQRAEYEGSFANSWYWRGADENAVDDLVDLLAAWDDPASLAEVQSTAAGLLVTTGRIDEAVALAEELGDVPPGFAAIRVALALGHGWRAQGHPVRAEARVSESLGFYRSVSPDVFLLSDAAMAGLLIQTLAEAGRFDELDQVVVDRAPSWRDLGASPTAALALLAQGSAWLARGDYEQAIRFGTEGLEQFETVRHPGMARWCRILIALAHAEPGDLAMANRHLTEIDAHRAHPAQIFESALARTRAWIAHHEGRPDAAVSLLERAVEAVLALGNVAAAIDCLHDLARQRHADVAAAWLDRIDTVDVEGDWHTTRLAHVRAAASDDVAALGRCAASFDRLSAPHLAAECALAAASSPSLTPTEVKFWLREAAKRTGGEVDLSRFLADSSLTAREREVARLAVQGLTSRQIADQLGNSRRTIDAHLGSVYSKLHVDGRAGLIQRLSSPGD